MIRRVSSRNIVIAESTYVELVRSLVDMLLPAAVMSTLFFGVAVLAVTSTEDCALLTLSLVGIVLSVIRFGIVLSARRNLEGRINDRRSARLFERRFAVCYIAFAIVLGQFGMRTMTLPDIALQMVVSSLLVGYAAGVAAGVSLRPRIGATSMTLAVIPAAIASLSTGQTLHIALGVVLIALLIGGLQSMHQRYAAEIDKIEIRKRMTGLARLDHLTGLANRLGLEEHFNDADRTEKAVSLIAVHALDLDRFKSINDRFGHPVGDELLRMVAGRLTTSLRAGDLAARIGGDEFVVLQLGIVDADEGARLAWHLHRALSEPYVLAGEGRNIGSSIGYVVSQNDESLGALLTQADNALYAIKASGGGAAAHSDITVGKAHITA